MVILIGILIGPDPLILTALTYKLYNLSLVKLTAVKLNIEISGLVTLIIPINFFLSSLLSSDMFVEEVIVPCNIVTEVLSIGLLSIGIFSEL